MKSNKQKVRMSKSRKARKIHTRKTRGGCGCSTCGGMSGGCGSCGGGMMSGGKKVSEINVIPIKLMLKPVVNNNRRTSGKKSKTQKGGNNPDFVAPTTMIPYNINTGTLHDPQTMLTDARQLPDFKGGNFKGGNFKGGNFKGGKRASKKIKGGSTGLLGYLTNNVNDFLLGNSTSPVINFGTSSGSVFSHNLLTNTAISSNAMNNQPVTSLFSAENKPVV